MNRENTFKGVHPDIVSEFINKMKRERPEEYFEAFINNVCPHCRKRSELQLMHQNCSYNEQVLNYYLACSKCQDEIWGLYQERWDEIYTPY